MSFDPVKTTRMCSTCHSVIAKHIVRILDAESEDQKKHEFSTGSDIHTADHGSRASHGSCLDLLNHMGSNLEACENGLGIRKSQEHDQEPTANPIPGCLYKVRENKLGALVLGAYG